jgi:hypothetical protein
MTSTVYFHSLLSPSGDCFVATITRACQGFTPVVGAHLNAALLQRDRIRIVSLPYEVFGLLPLDLSAATDCLDSGYVDRELP